MTRFQLSWWMKRRTTTPRGAGIPSIGMWRGFFGWEKSVGNLHLAEQQGAQISMVYGTAPAVQIAEYARVSGMAKIVMGRINHKSGAHHGENSPADQLTDLEVYILSNCQHLLRGRLENCVCRKHIFPGEMRASCGLRCCYPQET